MMTEQVYDQALVIAGELDARQSNLLRVLCGACVSSLAARLKRGLRPEDCREEFITAASLYALAALRDSDDVVEFKAGDLTVKQNTAETSAILSKELARQADLLIGPYLMDRFLFAGV